MSEPNVVHTLRRKRDEIESAIVAYEKRLQHARRDLQHVVATLQLFEAAADPDAVKPYQDIHRLFRRGEMVALCKAEMAKRAPLDTRELALAVMKAKGFAASDELRITITFKIVQALNMQAKFARDQPPGSSRMRCAEHGNTRMVVLLLLVIVAILLLGSSAFLGGVGLTLFLAVAIGTFVYAAQLFGLTWIWGFWGSLGLILISKLWADWYGRREDSRKRSLAESNERIAQLRAEYDAWEFTAVFMLLCFESIGVTSIQLGD